MEASTAHDLTLSVEADEVVYFRLVPFWVQLSDSLAFVFELGEVMSP